MIHIKRKGRNGIDGLSIYDNESMNISNFSIFITTVALINFRDGNCKVSNYLILTEYVVYKYYVISMFMIYLFSV